MLGTVHPHVCKKFDKTLVIGPFLLSELFIKFFFAPAGLSLEHSRTTKSPVQIIQVSVAGSGKWVARAIES